MLIYSIVLTILNLGLIIALLFYKGRVSRELASLRARAEALDPEAAAPPPDMAELYDDIKGGLITIEILNPIELAAKESWFAGIFGSVAPAMIRRLVYERAGKITKSMLADFGVDGELNVRYGP